MSRSRIEKKSSARQGTRRTPGQFSVLSWLLWITIMALLWQLLAAWIDHPLVFPDLGQIAAELAADLDQDFLLNIFWTFFRSFASMAGSVMLALGCAYLTFRNFWARSFLEKSCLVMQTIPAIGYLIILLFWTTREVTIFFVIFFLIFPVSFFSFLSELDLIHEQKKALILFYPNRRRLLFTRLYFPMMIPSLFSNLERGMILALKSCIMAEILVSASIGIGMRIQSDRLFFNVAGVISWIVWLVIISFAASFLLRRMRWIFRRYL